MKSIELFNWNKHLNSILNPNDQVKLLTDVLLNIYSNFIPNKDKTIRPHQAPWITQTIKNFLRNKNRVYKNFVRNGQPVEKLEGIQKMISEGSRMIEDAKQKYLLKVGNTLASQDTSAKKYWSLVNTVINKAKIPIIPPLFENGLFVTDSAQKAQLFNDYFIRQCTTIENGSKIPDHTSINPTRIDSVVISEEKILKII